MIFKRLVIHYTAKSLCSEVSLNNRNTTNGDSKIPKQKARKKKTPYGFCALYNVNYDFFSVQIGFLNFLEIIKTQL